jgi:putative transposase
MRLRELAGSRVRFGYRRLTVLLKREGWAVNAKRIYRLYTEEGLTVRTKYRKKAASHQRVPQGPATVPNQRWSMDFVSGRFVDGRWFRVLTVIDQFTRECLLLLVDSALSGEKVAVALEHVVSQRGVPMSIPVDNGSEFASRAMDAWAYGHGICLDFIRREIAEKSAQNGPRKARSSAFLWHSFAGRVRTLGASL